MREKRGGEEEDEERREKCKVKKGSREKGRKEGNN